MKGLYLAPKGRAPEKLTCQVLVYDGRMAMLDNADSGLRGGGLCSDLLNLPLCGWQENHVR